MDPITVGADTDIELRDGHGNFSFIISGKPHLKNGDKAIAPRVGLLVMHMTDGAWSVWSAQVRGAVIGARGLPTKRETEFFYSFGFGHPDEERESHHPDYAPPRWLTDFINGIQNRFNDQKGGS